MHMPAPAQGVDKLARRGPGASGTGDPVRARACPCATAKHQRKHVLDQRAHTQRRAEKLVMLMHRRRRHVVRTRSVKQGQGAESGPAIFDCLLPLSQIIGAY